MTRRKKEADRSNRSQPLAAAHGARPPVAALCGDRLRPWLLGCMTALCVARPLFPSESAALHGDGSTMVMLWIAICILWLLGAIGRPQFAIRFGWTDAAVLLLVGWHTAAALWATWHGSPRPAVNMLWEWIGMGLCFLLARQFIATTREARAVMAVMVALAVALSGYGLYQYGYEMPQTRATYEADPDRAMRDAGLWYPPASPERELFESRLYSAEPIATFALTNSLAAFLAPWLVMLAVVAYSSRVSRKRLLGMVVCAIPIVVCLLLTKSRSGYIATGVGLVLAWLSCRERTVGLRWKWPAAITLMAALIAVILGLRGPDRELLARASKSFGYRLQYWQASWQLISEHPIFGCGPGNFQNTYTQYKLPEAGEEVADPHNFLFEIWATAGTPALVALLAVLGCFAWAALSSAKEGERRQEEGGEESGQCAGDRGPFRPEPLAPGPESRVSRSLIANSSRDGCAHVLAGGAIGFLLSVPVGLLGAAPPGAAAVLMGLPLAAATMVLLRGWIKEGRLPPLLPAVGVVTLLVDLLATGGIGLPSVAGTLWLLLTLGLLGGRSHRLRPIRAWAMLLAATALALACYSTAYRPVLGCQAELRMAEREPSRSLTHLEAAATADPLSAEPWRRLAAIHFETWWQKPDEETFRRFEQSNSEALRLAPNSAPAWLAAGDWYFRAFSKMNQQAGKLARYAGERALEAYRQAVSLYPKGAVYRAKLAEASWATGDQLAFQREARLALQLDEATPHVSKKLPAELRDRLGRALGETP